MLDHPDAPIRSWTVRLLNDAGSITMRQRLVGLARSEPDAEVRSELASTAARLEVDAALAVLHELIRRQEDVSDKYARRSAARRHPHVYPARLGTWGRTRLP